MKTNLSNTTYFVICLAAAICFCACGDNPSLDMGAMFSSQEPSMAVRFEQSMDYGQQVGETHLDMKQDNYIVYACADSHIHKTHRNLEHFIRTYEAETQPKVAIHLGDLIDAQHNFPHADSILNIGGRAIDDTLFVTPGNHDIYFNQWEIYRSYYKRSVYWFDTNNGNKKLDLFICLDSAEGELGPEQMDWLKKLLADKANDYRHVIVFTHTHMWKLDMSQGHTSNFTLESTYELTSLFGQYGVDYVWSGHQHSRQSVIMKGVNYLVLDATQDKGNGQAYMTAEIGEDIIYHYHNYPQIEVSE